MSNEEFEVLDELYFVVAYEDLVAAVDLEEPHIRETLFSLISQGYVKCFADRDGQDEVALESLNYHAHYQRYTYLATKQGLLAHNAL